MMIKIVILMLILMINSDAEGRDIGKREAIDEDNEGKSGNTSIGVSSDETECMTNDHRHNC